MWVIYFITLTVGLQLQLQLMVLLFGQLEDGTHGVRRHEGALISVADVMGLALAFQLAPWSSTSFYSVLWSDYLCITLVPDSIMSVAVDLLLSFPFLPSYHSCSLFGAFNILPVSVLRPCCVCVCARSPILISCSAWLAAHFWIWSACMPHGFFLLHVKQGWLHGTPD